VGTAVDLSELVFGAGVADFEAFCFAGPALAFGLGDAGGEAVSYFLKPVPLGGVDAQHRAADAAVLVDAAGSVCPPAVAEGELAALEVAEELLPFGVGRGAVFGAGPQCAAAGEEGQVGLDGLVGVDGFVAEFCPPICPPA